jgi:hypothetical protein
MKLLQYEIFRLEQFIYKAPPDINAKLLEKAV